MTEAEAGKAALGVVGLGVMGRNLALNAEEHGFVVRVWNLETEWVDRFVTEHAGKGLSGAKTLEALVEGLARPRRILMMIKAGKPVEEMSQRLRPLLAPGDILVDGGNSRYQDTRRLESALLAHDLAFVGMGVSGGEEGARHGPSLMPGGSAEAYSALAPVLEAIAAKTEAGPCVTHVGPDGAGHFVKMVHNGIEYADMQIIAEVYDLLQRAAGLDAGAIVRIFDAWNRGPLASFLVELTAKVLAVRDDETGKPLVDLILDKAGQKGTGRWTAEAALELGVPAPTIAAAIDARVLSSMKEERIEAAERHAALRPGSFSGKRERLVEDVRKAFYGSRICAYAQGMHLIQAGSDEYGWNVDLTEIARIWKGGCIIRAALLDPIRRAYRKEKVLRNLLLDRSLGAALRRCRAGWRRALGVAQKVGVPAPALGASLAYFDAYRAARLPHNLIQAQRDAFGAHTYERIDRTDAGPLHTRWLK